MTFHWRQCYAEDRTPWDLGEPHPELTARLAAGEGGPPGRAFVPGCGRGHDALALARAGWSVTAVDCVDVPGGPAAELADRGGEFIVGDALAYRPPGERFDLVFEHTFLCALDLSDRAAWGRMVNEVLAPAGRLWVVLWPHDKPREKGGPPHRLRIEDLTDALGDGFRILIDEPETHTVPTRTWRGRWVYGVRTNSAAFP